MPFDGETRAGVSPVRAGQENVPPVPENSFPAEGSETAAFRLTRPFSWQGFLEYCASRQDAPSGFSAFIRQQRGEEQSGELRLTPSTAFSSTQLEAYVKNGYIPELVRGYCGGELPIRILQPENPTRKGAELRREMQAHPGVALLEKHMGARILDCGENRV